MTIKILFEDENYLIAYKPSGMVVHSTVDKNRTNFFDLLKTQTNNENLALIQRLDVSTSGLMIFSKSKEANIYLDQLMKEHLIEKKYFALVLGKTNFQTEKLDVYLKKKKVKGIDLSEVVKSGGDRAITILNTVKNENNYSLIECEIKSGKMHQIRSVLSHLGFPIVGDLDYGGIPNPRTLLMSYSIKFFDKFSNRVIKVEIECDHDFSRGAISKSYIKFFKPFGVLCQFTKETPNDKTLLDFNFPKDVYPIGRLDKDSEGLLLLSNDKSIVDLLLNPKNEKEKNYLACVEGVPTLEKIKELESGVSIEDYKTKPCSITLLNQEPVLPERNPPIRFRKNSPTSWLDIKIHEGKNRQVRKMTAKIGYPTLRLVRIGFSLITIDDLSLGEWKMLTEDEIKRLLKISKK